MPLEEDTQTSPAPRPPGLGGFRSIDSLTIHDSSDPSHESPSMPRTTGGFFTRPVSMGSVSEGGLADARTVRIKRVEHGRAAAGDEFLAAFLGALAGLSPRMDYIVDRQRNSGGAVREEPARPRLASYLINTFMDLGDFVVSLEALRHVAPERRDDANRLRRELTDLREGRFRSEADEACDSIDKLETKLASQGPASTHRQKTQDVIGKGDLPEVSAAITEARRAQASLRQRFAHVEHGHRLAPSAQPARRVIQDEVAIEAAGREFAAYGDTDRQRLRALYRREQRLTAELFDCFPRSAQTTFLSTLIASGVLNAHWDLVNHRGANTGFYLEAAEPLSRNVPGAQVLRASVVDCGNTHSSGFSGQSKGDSPIVVVGLPALTATGLGNRLHVRDLLGVRGVNDATGGGQLGAGWLGVGVPPGGVPRSDVYVRLFEKTLKGRDGTDLARSEPHLMAAYRLRRVLPLLSHELGEHLDRAAANAFKSHGQEFLAREGHGAAFFKDRVEEARKRVQAYIEVIGLDAVERWASRNPDVTRHIDREIGAPTWECRASAPVAGRVRHRACSAPAVARQSSGVIEPHGAAATAAPRRATPRAPQSPARG